MLTLTKHSGRDQLVAVRISDPYYREYNEFRAKVGMKNGKLLRIIFKLGLTEAKYLHQKGEFKPSIQKLQAAVAGLSLDEKADLLELLKAELQV